MSEILFIVLLVVLFTHGMATLAWWLIAAAVAVVVFLAIDG